MVRSVKRTCLLGAVLSVLSSSGVAVAQEAVDRAWLDQQVNERGQHCERHGEQRSAAGIMLACGTAGVWVVTSDEAGPKLVRSYDLGGEVVGFFTEADGRLWVKLLMLQAKPFSPTPGGSAQFPDSVALG